MLEEEVVVELTVIVVPTFEVRSRVLWVRLLRCGEAETANAVTEFVIEGADNLKDVAVYVVAYEWMVEGAVFCRLEFGGQWWIVFLVVAGLW